MEKIKFITANGLQINIEKALEIDKTTDLKNLWYGLNSTYNFGCCVYLYKKYGELISKKSEEKKTKNNILKLLKANLRNQLIPICNRVSRINAMISNDNQYSQERNTSADGFNNHKFCLLLTSKFFNFSFIKNS